MDIAWEDMRLFLAVAETGSFSSAAKRLQLGQPTVSRRLADLEYVLGYKLFIWRGLHANAYLRYWPNVATTLDDDRLVLDGPGGPIVHRAHDFKLFANVSLGWAFDI